MNASVLKLADAQPQPWKNGGGVTRELLAWPSPAGWRVRVSVAEVSRAGPFSPFPGVRRWIVAVEPADLLLDVAGETRRVTRAGPPVEFDGAAAASCRLPDGPSRDLNLMLRDADGGLACVEDGVEWLPRTAMCGLFTVASGHCEAGEADIEVPAYALVWFDPSPPRLRFTARERVAPPPGWWIAATIRDRAG